ncbi:hypothetical protein [Hymenobacter sp. CRA2]|uniref:hypothetical protein n=1 Tax=Hymenobacter sp. CRA2 TaxID=1955620 RepID=UPI00098F779E|nr:hypothetical protein [Hymenobacter sp. CRA2]OON70814.1 hypothetical protein B0919_02030 [Hymenobacter sp. CRA2]
MRLFRSLYLLALLPLAVACETPDRTPLLDFVSNGTATTGDRTASAGDTIEVRVFAQTSDLGQDRSEDPPLKSLTITAQEQFYLDANRPEFRDTLTYYFRDKINSQSFSFTHRFSASTNAGRQTWVYTALDEAGNRATRRITVTVRPADSLAALHSYTVRLQPPLNRTNRAALAALRGFALPPHATDTLDYQRLTDILYVPTTAGPTLASPTSATASPNFRVQDWTVRRLTVLAVTSLSSTSFANITNETALTAAVTAAAPSASSTAPLAKGRVVAFRTADGNDGLINVSDISTTTGVLTLDVKVRRR